MFFWEIFLEYSQKLQILLSFFLTYFGNFIYSSPNSWNYIDADASLPSQRPKMQFLMKLVKDCESTGIFQDPTEYLRWRYLRKKLTAFSRSLFL